MRASPATTTRSICLPPPPSCSRAIAHGLWNKGRALAELGARLPDAGYSVSVRFQKPVLLPAEVRLLASEPGSHGQFSLLGQNDLSHMSGSWQPLD